MTKCAGILVGRQRAQPGGFQELRVRVQKLQRSGFVRRAGPGLLLDGRKERRQTVAGDDAGRVRRAGIRLRRCRRQQLFDRRYGFPKSKIFFFFF